MSKRVLVVEDQADNRQIIRDMLAPTDYEISEAEDGEEVLTAVAKQRPDLILMGIQLPIMDGYEVTPASRPIPRCDRFRSSPSLPTRWMGKNRQRARRDVMTMCRSLTVLGTYWRKFNSTCPVRSRSTAEPHVSAQNRDIVLSVAACKPYAHGRPPCSLTCGRVLFPRGDILPSYPGLIVCTGEAHEATGFHWPARRRGSLAPSPCIRAESVKAAADRGSDWRV